MGTTISACAGWSDTFHGSINDPIERTLRIVQFGGVLLGVAGFEPIAARLCRYRDLLFCTWIVDDVVRGLDGTAYTYFGERRLPSTAEEIKDSCLGIMDFFYPLLVYTEWERFPALQHVVNTSWAIANGIKAATGDTPGKQASGLCDTLYSLTFLPLVPWPPAMRSWTGLLSGVVFFGSKLWVNKSSSSPLSS